MRTLVVVLVCAASACGGKSADEAKSAQPAPVAETPKPAAATPPPAKNEDKPAAAAAATDRITDPSFELMFASAGPYKVGQLGTLGVSLKARGAYHVNQEYPIEVTLRAPPGLSMPKLEYKRADAAEFAEKSARFDVPLTPAQAGPQRVEANVRFAVCTPENCVPDERTLAIALPVE